MREKPKIKSTRVILPIGSSSLIVVFIVLCMSIFTAITYVTAANEKKLTIQTAEYQRKYYMANEEISITLSNLQKELDSQKKPDIHCFLTYNPVRVNIYENNNSFDFEYPIDDSLSIKVTGFVENGIIKVDSCVVYNVNAGMVPEDEFLNFFEGDVEFEGFAEDFGSGGE